MSAMETSRLPGGTPMVKIDGTRVRQLRESRGLTQLYVATAVGVTTDTISRWENKRYPTIKKENGLKLAEALEVELGEILDQGGTGEEPAPEEEEVAEPSVATAKPGDSSPPSPGRSLFLPLTLLVLAVLAVTGWWLTSAKKVVHINAQRLLPGKTVPGQPFPVAITVNTDAASPLSLILKEQLPGGAELVSAVPAYSAYDPGTGEIKWLQKINGEQIFAYVVKLDFPLGEKIGFDGTVAVRKGSGRQTDVRGDQAVQMGNFHWADTDNDSRICDEEILVVYDVFSEIKGLAFDIDQVEEIWLGSGYRWDPEEQKFVILP